MESADAMAPWYETTAARLARIEAAVAHNHALLHGILDAVQEMSRGGMNAAEVSAVVERLRLTSARLGAAAHGSPENKVTGVADVTSPKAVPQNLQDVLTQLDADTTACAGVINDLRGQIKVGMTQAEVDGVVGTMAAIASRLEAAAKDPNAPVPPGPVPQAKK